MKIIKFRGNKAPKCLLLLLLFSISTYFQVIGQSHKSECSTEISADLYKMYQEDNLRNDYEELSRTNMPFTVPVRFSVLRRTDGTTNTTIPMDLTRVQTEIDFLNLRYADNEMTFVLCGDPVYIDSDYYYYDHYASLK